MAARGRRAVGSLLALGAALALAGCDRQVEDPAAYAQTPEIVRERAAATRHLDEVIARFHGLGQVLGTATSDVCDPGQANFKTKTVWRFSCDAQRAILVKPSQPTVAAATGSLQQAVAAAGCSELQFMGGPLTAAQVESKLKEGMVSFARTDCGGQAVVVGWAVDPDSVARRNWSYPPGPHGVTVEFTGFDQAALSAIEPKPLVWWIGATQRYHYEKR